MATGPREHSRARGGGAGLVRCAPLPQALCWAAGWAGGGLAEDCWRVCLPSAHVATGGGLLNTEPGKGKETQGR